MNETLNNRQHRTQQNMSHSATEVLKKIPTPLVGVVNMGASRGTQKDTHDMDWHC
jgi:hypothetical protein